MKYYISILAMLIAQLNLFSQMPDNSKFQLQKNIFSPRIVSIRGEFWGQLPAFEKKDASGSVLFKTDGGVLQFRINGVIKRDKQNLVIITLFVNDVPGQYLDISALIKNTQVAYQIEGKGFGTYGGENISDDNYKITTRIKLIAPGYPDYYLEFPAIVQVTASGLVDNVFSFIPNVAEYFRLYQEETKLKPVKPELTISSERQVKPH